MHRISYALHLPSTKIQAGLLAFAVLSGVFTTGLHAQLSTTATISGTVMDQTGAVIPGASISIRDLNTNAATATNSNNDGSFVVPGLPVDAYSVTISKPGFGTFSSTGIVLHPATTTSVIARLKPGAANTSVTVSAAAVEVETATPEIANSVYSAQVSTLPLNGRNYQGLASAMPGVQNLSAGTALGTGGRSTDSELSVNGGQNFQTFYALDGIWNENSGNMEQTAVIPNPDSLEEVRVLQNNYSARYSLMGATVVLLQTKSGTSSFHGSAWDFLRNDDLNSKPYFNSSVLPYKQNIFGYTLGGPLFIPRVYNTDKRKTFFFGSEQFVILHKIVSNLTGITPTQNQRNGIFSSQIDMPGTSTPFPQNAAGQYYIPTANINSDSLAYLTTLYPLPNYSGSGSTNYINVKPQITDQQDDEIKGDHYFNSRLHLLGEYLDEYQTLTQNSLGIYPTNWESDYTHNHLAQVAFTATLSQNMINTANIAMDIYLLDLDPEGLVDVNQVPGLQTSLPYDGYLSNRIPIVGFSGGVASEGIPISLPRKHAGDLTDTVGDDWSWLLGKNFFQSGISIVFHTKRQPQEAASQGQFSFTGQFTSPATGAVTQDDALADFLLGDAATFTQATTVPVTVVHGMEVSPYFEDRFQLTRNLTVTAGLRILHTPLPHPAQPETIFDPSAYSIGEAPIVNNNGTITTTSSYNPLNGLVTNGTDGLPNNFSLGPSWYFGPEMGFAWDIFGDGKTSFRGGYGITYVRTFTNQDCSFNCALNPPGLQTTNLINTDFPDPVAAGTIAPATIQTLSSADLRIRSTQVQSYSLSLQREFPGNWIAEVTGASSLGHHVRGVWNYNQPPHDGAFDFNPIINAGTITPYQFAPYLGYGDISTLASRNNQNWNALEADLRHPVSANLFLTLAYTYSHDLTDLTNSTVIDPYNPKGSYGNAEGINFPNSFSTTAIYSLPWLQNAKGAEALVLRGWKYSDITEWRSGPSMSPGLSVPLQGLAARPDRVPGVSLKGPRTTAEWFNAAAFEAPQPGYYGNAGTGILQGPGLVDFDMALYKDFHITEGSFFAFRAEAFNIFNHTNFTSLQTTFGASGFGNVTGANDPRILEFALSYHF
jgi:Carboxypeptidase regulatory-like domain